MWVSVPNRTIDLMYESGMKEETTSCFVEVP